MKIIKLSVPILLFSFIFSYSQFSGNGNDQVTQSAVYLKPVQTLPPLHTDMSLDCFIGYVAMDSVSRNIYGVPVMNFIETTTIDTIKMIARYMYSVCDYNPTLFRRYVTMLRDSIPNANFKSSPANFYYTTQNKIFEPNRIDKFGRDYALLVRSNYILKIRLDSVIVGIDTTFKEKMDWVNAAGTVTEKIKGQALPLNCSSTGDSLTASCIIFGYPLNARTGFLNEGDTACGTLDSVVKNNEYFLFLEHVSIRKGVDYIHPVYKIEKNGGLFKIVNGKVEDLSNFWGLGSEPTVEEFKTNLLNKISIIKNW